MTPSPVPSLDAALDAFCAALPADGPAAPTWADLGPEERDVTREHFAPAVRAALAAASPVPSSADGPTQQRAAAFLAAHDHGGLACTCAACGFARASLALTERVAAVEAGLAEALDSLTEARSYIRTEAPHAPTLLDMSRVIRVVRAALTGSPS